VQSRGVQYGPGIGFAYALNSKTVIRTGGRIAYDRMQGNPWYSCLGVPPTTRAGTLYYGNLTTLNQTTAAFSAPHNGAGLSPDGHIPPVYSYNFSIQRDCRFATMVEASYVGNLTGTWMSWSISHAGLGRHVLPQNQDPASRAPKIWMAAARCRHFTAPCGARPLNYPPGRTATTTVSGDRSGAWPKT